MNKKVWTYQRSEEARRAMYAHNDEYRKQNPAVIKKIKKRYYANHKQDVIRKTTEWRKKKREEVNQMTYEQLIQIVGNKTLTQKELGKQMGVSEGFVASTISLFRNYEKGNKPSYMTEKFAQMCDRYLVEHSQAQEKVSTHQPEKIVESTQVVTGDNYAFLSQAQATYNQALADFIAQEVAKQSQEAVKEKELELQRVREKYEKELARMQAIIVKMQDSSVVGLIRGKLGLQA